MKYSLVFQLSLILIVLSACSGSADIPDVQRDDIDWNAVVAASDPVQQVSWQADVQPILEQRCMVCHGCFDAPCQLKLTSFEGLQRGASSEKVYDGARIKAASPTRLFIDANGRDEWRAKGFHGVLAEGEYATAGDPSSLLRESVLYRLLRLKELNPQPRTGLLPDALTLGLDRVQSCVQAGDIAKYERDKPLWGMPYAMPNLEGEEYRTLVQWLAEGAQGPEPVRNSAEADRQIAVWEVFFNGSSMREQLMSRYIYEHLFLGHIHLEHTPTREFYRMVRSYTPPGDAIRELPMVRPFDAPDAPFWYRLRRYESSIVAKSHVVYSLSAEKRQRYQELFLQPDYSVEELPGYALPDAANPFQVFAAIPAESRYKFLLDDARFFIQGFIKGPVCRGQVALNVIEDHFWVVFANPDRAGAEDSDEILQEVAQYLNIPSKTQTLNPLATYTHFWRGQKAYLQRKSEYIAAVAPQDEAEVMEWIWAGNGNNRNAALTIIRNFDSAAVEFGLLGDYPETAWIIDYPLLERIHYLLVAAFDVYGNVGHQLNSRLFMDFLRMEGEDNFLAFMPVDARKQIRDKWYEGIRSKRSKYFAEPIDWLGLELPVNYQSSDPQREFYRKLELRLGDMAGAPDFLNRCDADCRSSGNFAAQHIHEALLALSAMKGQQLELFPDVSLIRVVTGEGEDHAYSLMHNKMYQNLGSVFSDGRDQHRDRSKDTLTVLRGVFGSYPNFFFVVDESQLNEFVAAAEAIVTTADSYRFVARFGVRRTGFDFWEHADWFQQRYAALEPLESGILDLSRYENR